MRHRKVGYLKTVWILGAGFSKSLGGPLMEGLLRYQRRDDLAAQLESSADVARRIHQALVLFKQGTKERQWTDPEMFLDALETMRDSAGGGAAERLSGLMDRAQTESRRLPTGADFGTEGPPQGDPKGLAVAGKRALALDCISFLRTADAKAERWKPYAAWARSIGELRKNHPDRPHTVLTFNYDRVLEKLNESTGAFHVVLPSVQSDEKKTVPRSDQPGEGKVEVFKVHGSVDWKKVSDGPVRAEVGRPEEALLCSDDELALATPGPGKSNSAFETLWGFAEKAIQEAQVVVFLGYRFPQGDADARRRILSAVARNEQQCLVLMPVLGPNLMSVDLRRTTELLRSVVERSRQDGWFETNSSKTYKIWPRPLWAEDFLSLYAELGIGELESEPKGAVSI